MKSQSYNHHHTTLENLGILLLFALVLMAGIAFNVAAALLAGLLFGLM